MPHSIEHLQPGDILINGDGHTMIYIGMNIMVHAMPQSGLCRVKMLTDYGTWDGSWGLSLAHQRPWHLGGQVRCILDPYGRLDHGLRAQ